MNETIPHTSPVYYDPNGVAHDLRDFDNIPDELRAKQQWVLWMLEMVDGRLTKVPYTVAGGKASATNPQTWATFESCRDALRSNKFSGLGFVFADGGELTGIDLDKHRDPATGELDSFAAECVARLNSYTEESQSGTGAHIIARAAIVQPSVASWPHEIQNLRLAHAIQRRNDCLVRSGAAAAPARWPPRTHRRHSTPPPANGVRCSRPRWFFPARPGARRWRPSVKPQVDSHFNRPGPGFASKPEFGYI